MARRQRGEDLRRYIVLRRLDKLNPLAGLVLESGDDLARRRVLLWVKTFLPPDDEISAPGAEGRHHEHPGQYNVSTAHHRRSLVHRRIRLIHRSLPAPSRQSKPHRVAASGPGSHG
jgi:hypothetical protein